MGTELWHPDIAISDDFAKNLIEDQFKELTPVKIKCIGEGWDNKVFLVNGHFIFRFPHREIAGQLIERENAVLKSIHRVVNLETPNPTYVGQPSNDYPYNFHGYSMIKGKSGCHANLTLEERVNSITPLAKFLKTLHGISEQQAIKIGAKPQVFDRTKSSKVIEELNERVNKIITRDIALINKSVFQDEMSIAKGINLPPNKVLVHGDLYCRHLMFHEGQLTGVIDWGDVGINSPAVDLAVIFSFYPPKTHHVFLDIYGKVDSQTWDNARFLGLYSAITVMLYGHDIGDELLVAEAKDAIKRINPMLFVGGA